MNLHRARPAALAALLALTAVSTEAQRPRLDQDAWAGARRDMVSEQIRERGVREPTVLRAMETVPRHLFIPPEHREQAYGDTPLPIGWGQTISQPYIVALMTDLLDLDKGDKVLEIGTGSGYHAAVLSRVAGQVYTIEIIENLGRQAKATLQELGYGNVNVRIGDGYKGWPEAAPFDAIMVTCAPDHVPQPLVDQLKEGGRMIIPVGPAGNQELYILRKQGNKVEKRAVLPVRFVPMTGRKIPDVKP